MFVLGALLGWLVAFLRSDLLLMDERDLHVGLHYICEYDTKAAFSTNSMDDF